MWEGEADVTVRALEVRVRRSLEHLVGHHEPLPIRSTLPERRVLVTGQASRVVLGHECDGRHEDGQPEDRAALEDAADGALRSIHTLISCPAAIRSEFA